MSPPSSIRSPRLYAGASASSSSAPARTRRRPWSPWFITRRHSARSTAGEDNTARLWDTHTHKQVAALTGHTASVLGVAFSPDGKVLATAGYDNIARLWDTFNHKQLAILPGHTGTAIQSVAFSADGKVLAAGCNDNSSRLWDIAGHKQIATLSGHDSSVSAVAFSPDGRTLASASADMTARLWTDTYWRDEGELRDGVCDLLGSGLSRTEWDRYVTGIPYRNSCS